MRLCCSAPQVFRHPGLQRPTQFSPSLKSPSPLPPGHLSYHVSEFDAPQGAFLFQPMATPCENRRQKRIRPERAPSPARSIRKRGFLMGRPFRASCLITDQTHGVAMGCEWPPPWGRNTPVIIESWYQSKRPTRNRVASGERTTPEREPALPVFSTAVPFAPRSPTRGIHPVPPKHVI